MLYILRAWPLNYQQAALQLQTLPAPFDGTTSACSPEIAFPGDYMVCQHTKRAKPLRLGSCLCVLAGRMLVVIEECQVRLRMQLDGTQHELRLIGSQLLALCRTALYTFDTWTWAAAPPMLDPRDTGLPLAAVGPTALAFRVRRHETPEGPQQAVWTQSCTAGASRELVRVQVQFSCSHTNKQPLAFSPCGRWLAIADVVEDAVELQFASLATGELVAQWRAPPLPEYLYISEIGTISLCWLHPACLAISLDTCALVLKLGLGM